MLNRPTIERYVSALLPDTAVMWTQDRDPLDGTVYTWQIECRRAGSDTTVLWTKTSGLTGQVGTASTASLVIAWAAGDLGTLTAGRYVLEVSGTSGGKARKRQIDLVVHAEV